MLIGSLIQHMQDQIIIFMALAEGKSEVRCGKEGLSLHTKSVPTYIHANACYNYL